MAFENPSDDQLRDLLQRVRTIAIVGFSPKKDRASHGVALAMQRFGYRIIPVRPALYDAWQEIMPMLRREAPASDLRRVRAGVRDRRFSRSLHKIKLDDSQRIIEVGCGTGAILSELPTHIPLHSLDIDPAALAQCRVHTSAASLIQGNALSLPYSNRSFDVVYCHFLLLWVRDPLQALVEMKRVTKAGGTIIAFAEPDYTKRIDKPDELIPLGKWQTESLRRQGADPGFGAKLAESFFGAGIQIFETGTIHSVGNEASAEEWEIEWAVIEADLAGSVPGEDIQKMKLLDKAAREHGKRVLHVPTHFAWGQK